MKHSRSKALDPTARRRRFGILYLSGNRQHSRNLLCLTLLFALLSIGTCAAAREKSDRPNIVLILADDLGYGDTGSYGATRIATPNIDRLAEEGMRFTDAYAASPLCTPTRYALLSGIYPWRIPIEEDRQLWATHLTGSLLQEGQPTLASILKKAGYHNGVVGKWHLGLGRWNEERDWNKELKPGPLELGFDSFFGDVSNRFRFYIENHRVAGLSGQDRIEGANRNLVAPDSVWQIDLQQNGRVLTEKACEFIRRSADREPFFLYYAPNLVHVPLTPGEDFLGTSHAGLYGDFAQELDWSVGQILATLRDTGTLDDTLILFTSDNGGFYTLSALQAGHRTNSPLLGQKTDVWEGGIRVPFIAHWPGVIPQKTEVDVPICLTDVLATMSELVGVASAGARVNDGMSILGLLKGADPGPGLLERALVLNVGQRTLAFAVRQGDWVYINCQGSGGVSAGKDWPNAQGFLPYETLGFENSDVNPDGKIRSGMPPAQLYNLKRDPSQKTNVILEYPEKARQLERMLAEIKEANPYARWQLPGMETGR